MEAATGERAGAAVLIGIGSYLLAEQVWPLRYAAHDAEAMADVLSDPEVCGFPRAQGQAPHRSGGLARRGHTPSRQMASRAGSRS